MYGEYKPSNNCRELLALRLTLKKPLDVPRYKVSLSKEVWPIDKIDRLLNRLERVSIKHWWYDEWTTPIIKTYQLNGVRVVVTPHGDIKVDDWRINTQRDQTVRAIELFDCVTTKMGVSMDIAIDEALK